MTIKRKGTNCSYLHNFFLNTYTTMPPSEEEWDKVCEITRQNLKDIKGTLIYTEGGAPSQEQHLRYRAVWREGNTTYSGSVVLHESETVREIINTRNKLSGQSIISLPPQDWEGAFNYLKVPPEHQDAIRAELMRLRNELNE